MKSSPRQTIEIRKDDILVAAIQEFASRGLYATSTNTIAEIAGISQPYLFKVWKTKTLLFLAALDQVFDSIIQTFEAEAKGKTPSVQTLAAVGEVYDRLSRSEMQMLLQGFAACDQPEVRLLVERRWMELIACLMRIAGTGGDPVQHFLGFGLLMTVVRAAGLPDRALMCESD
jgi:TetR/AcrR family transcriptional regulator